MKTFIYTFLSFCLLSLAFFHSYLQAQSFEHCWQEFFISSAYDVAYSEYDDTWVVGGQNGNFNFNNWPSFDAYVTKFDREGNLLWQVNNLTREEIGNIREILPLPNGDILVGGSVGLCDVGPVTHLFKLNSEGEILWEEDHLENWGDDIFSEFHIIADNQVILLEYEQISLMDWEGNFIWSFPLEGANYSPPTLAVMNENQLLIGGRNFLRIYESESGNLLQEQTFQETEVWKAEAVLNIVPLQEVGKYLALLDNNTILLIDDNLTTLESFDLSSFFETSYRLSSLPNHRLALLGKYQEQSKLAILDESLNIVKDFYFGANSTNLSSIKGLENRVAVAGSYPSNRGTNSAGYLLYGSSASFIKVLSINDEITIGEIDAGIEKFEFSDAELLGAGSCWGEGLPLSQIFLKDVKVSLKNFGETPIEDIQVNFRSDNSCFSICLSTFTIMEKVENIDIEANTSYVFNLGDIIIPNKLTQSSYEICFWTSIPNEKIDVNGSNDLYCETVVFTDIEDKNPLSSFNVFPNPSQDKFTVEVTSPQNKELQLQLLNTQGQVLYQTNFSQTLEMDLSSYPIGVYLLKVSDGFNRYTKKLLKN